MDIIGKLSKKIHQLLDRNAFDDFIQRARIGEKWEPWEKDMWPIYKIIVGASEKHFYKDNAFFYKNVERRWFKTATPNLYLTEIWENSQLERTQLKFHKF
jgi:hypothetical protein